MRIFAAVGLVASLVAAPSMAGTLQDADMLFARGDFQAAQLAYQSVAPTDDGYKFALRRLGAIALYENRFDDAQKFLLAALSRGPDDAKTGALLAELASRRDAFPEAASWLTRLHRPDKAAVFAMFGNARPYRIASRVAGATIPFVQSDPLPAVRATVNGRSGLFLVDTGGSEVLLDSLFAAAAKVPAAGRNQGIYAGGKTATTAYGRIAQMSLGALTLDDVPALLLSTNGFSAAAQGKYVAGVIGTQLLSRFRATIDYQAGKLILAPPDSPTTQGNALAEIPFWLVGDHYMLARGALNGGHDQTFLVDTGLAGFAFTAPESTLRDAGIAIPAPAAPANNAVGQSAAASFSIASLSLGTLEVKNLQGLYGPFPPQIEMALGTRIGGIVSHAFFKPYAVTFDFKAMKILVRKSGA